MKQLWTSLLQPISPSGMIVRGLLRRMREWMNGHEPWTWTSKIFSSTGGFDTSRLIRTRAGYSATAKVITKLYLTKFNRLSVVVSRDPMHFALCYLHFFLFPFSLSPGCRLAAIRVNGWRVTSFAFEPELKLVIFNNSGYGCMAVWLYDHVSLNLILICRKCVTASRLGYHLHLSYLSICRPYRAGK